MQKGVVKMEHNLVEVVRMYFTVEEWVSIEIVATTQGTV